jgi:WD40 repeat protein
VSSVAKLWHKLTGILSAHSGNTLDGSAGSQREGSGGKSSSDPLKNVGDPLPGPNQERSDPQGVAETTPDFPDETGRQPVPGVTLFRSFKGHQSAVRCVAFDPEGLMLASGSSDATIKLWDLSSGNLVNTYVGQFKNGYFGLAFDVAGGTLASGTNKGIIEQRAAKSSAHLNGDAMVRSSVWPLIRKDAGWWVAAITA